MIEFKLEGHEYITLNNIMKLLNLAQSGGDANQIIDSGMVWVNNKIELQKRKKLKAGDIVKFQNIVITIIL